MQKGNTAILVLCGVVLLLVGLLGGYYVFSALTDQESTNQSAVINAPVNTAAGANVNAGHTPLPPDIVSPLANAVVEDEDIIPAETTPTENDTDLVQLEDLHLTTAEYNQYISDEFAPAYYLAGAIDQAPYEGAELILADIDPYGPAFYPSFFRFARKDGAYTLLALHSTQWVGDLDATKFTTDTETILDAYDYPAYLQGENSRQVLKLDPNPNAFFTAEGLRLAFTDSTWGDVYTTAETTLAQGIFAKHGFYLEAPDGTVRVYQLDLDFQDENGIPAVQWEDGIPNYTAYTFADVGGCGYQNYQTVITDGSFAIDENLTQVGVTSRGDSIYVPTDPADALLQNLYDEGSWVNTYEGETKPSYDEFVAARPYIFVVDAFDRLIRGQSNEYVPMAECAKPAIYLYPEKTTNISIRVEPQGGMTVSDPAYGDGWAITASPDGSLVNHADGQTYPYLFWEGKGALYEQPTRGFVVARGVVPRFLERTLAAQGLNRQERADFTDYWVPLMQDAPWYFITFLGTQTMDQLAPLTVDPRPDTSIRVLMDFTPLEQPIAVAGYEIRTPQRHGFTVVEWGGVRR